MYTLQGKGISMRNAGEALRTEERVPFDRFRLSTSRLSFSNHGISRHEKYDTHRIHTHPAFLLRMESGKILSTPST